MDETKYTVRQIQYNGLAWIRNQDFDGATAIGILSHKLEVWNYEQEERVFVSDVHFIDVQVEEVITGRAMSNGDFGLVRELLEKINPAIKIIKAETIM